jgi:hypothetical protein
MDEKRSLDLRPNFGFFLSLRWAMNSQFAAETRQIHVNTQGKI